MAWIPPLEMNMNISRTVLEGKWDNPVIATLQKIALYTIIPFMLIATFEAIFKNLILINLANCLISILNLAHYLYQKYVRPILNLVRSKLCCCPCSS